MEDPEPRARLWQDFRVVQRYRESQRLCANPNGPIAKAIANSPLRVEGEPALLEDYQRVLPTYETKPGSGKPRGYWFPGKISQLAEGLGRQAEYQYFYAWSSGVAHVTPLYAGDRRQLLSSTFLFMAHTLYARMMTLAADHFRVLVDGELYQVWERVARGDLLS